MAGALTAGALTAGVMQVRVARQTGRLPEVVGFYRDGVGLPVVGGFTDHDGYSGVMVDLPGTGAHLEFTATLHGASPVAHPEDLLVLYLGSRAAVDAVLARVGGSTVASANPYWDRVGVTVTDPDGFRVVLVADSWTAQATLPPDGAPLRPDGVVGR